MPNHPSTSAFHIDLPGPSRTVDIPVSPSTRSHVSFLDSDNFFTSPKQVPVPTAMLGSHSAPGNTAQGSRDSSSHGVEPNSYSTYHERRPDRRRRQMQHEWSLFSQVMENEGRIQTPRVERVTDPFTSHNSPLPTPTRNPNDAYPDIPDVSSPTQEREAYLPEDSGSVSTECGSDNSSATSVAAPASPPSGILHRLTNIPVLHRNVLKCSLAYLIASLFTFSPWLSSFVSDLAPGPDDSGPLPSGHMIATIVVYFIPAVTTGGMLKANFYVFVGLLYAAVICLSSMSFYWWLERKPGWEWAGDFIVISWIGMGMCALAWMKVWMQNPSFNTACSMTSIVLFVVILKEGGLELLLEMSFIVLLGAIITNLVCHLAWRQTATGNLQANVSKTLDSFATILTLLSDTFLLEEREHLVSHDRLQKAIGGHQSSFTSLRKNVDEAKAEWLFRGTEEEFDLASVAIYGLDNPSFCKEKSHRSWGSSYEDVVDSITRLAQHLNGLRSGTRLQHELCRAGLGRSKLRETIKSDEDEVTALLRTAAAIFGELIDDIGPPLNALSSTCTTCLRRLRENFTQRRSRGQKPTFQPDDYVSLIESIEKALLRFESTSNHAMMRVYRRSDILQSGDISESVNSVGDGTQDDQLENIFLVYYFVFTLQEFAGELVSLVEAVARVSWIEQRRTDRGPWWTRALRCTSASVHSVFKRSCHSQTTLNTPRRGLGLQRSFTQYIIPQKLRNHKRAVAFPKIRPHAPDTILTPSRTNMNWSGRLKQRLWSLGNRLRERDTKFAIKTGISMAALAAPGFFDVTRPFFIEYFGQWALISFIVVMSPTIGATNNMSLHRILGTIFGAFVATVGFVLFNDLPAILVAFGWVFSLPCFYVIVSQPALASSARLVLLSYNLTCLYSYNLRQHDVAVVHIALHRVIAVTAGVVWAGFISRAWWPAEARRELSKALGEFCLNLGWLYMRLVMTNSYSPDAPKEGRNGDAQEDTPLLQQTAGQRLNESSKDFMAMELHLQIKLIEAQGLLAQAQHEPRLKGPFPVQIYRSMLTNLQMILDKLHSMRCVTTKEEWYTNVRDDFIIPVNRERKEMVGNIVLSFSVLSAAFLLKAPLPPYLPPAEKARQRLVEAIQGLDVVKNREVKASRQLLFFAYALTMKGVTQELELLGRKLQDAFGVIGQTPEEFDALFVLKNEHRREIESIA